MRNKETYTVFNASDVEHQHVERDKEPLQCKLLLREDFVVTPWPFCATITGLLRR